MPNPACFAASIAGRSLSSTLAIPTTSGCNAPIPPIYRLIPASCLCWTSALFTISIRACVLVKFGLFSAFVTPNVNSAACPSGVVIAPLLAAICNTPVALFLSPSAEIAEAIACAFSSLAISAVSLRFLASTNADLKRSSASAASLEASCSFLVSPVSLDIASSSYK